MVIKTVPCYPKRPNFEDSTIGFGERDEHGTRYL